MSSFKKLKEIVKNIFLFHKCYPLTALNYLKEIFSKTSPSVFGNYDCLTLNVSPRRFKNKPFENRQF